MALKMNYWEKLFHTCAIVWGTAFIVGYSGIANAELTSTSSVTAKVTDYTKTVIKQIPYKVEVCKDVHVSGDKTADALTGAIIGGIIGNNVTKNLPDGLVVPMPTLPSLSIRIRSAGEVELAAVVLNVIYDG